MTTRPSHHRYAETFRHSPRDGFTAYGVLSLVTGLSCHHRLPIISPNLTPASGHQDHTISPSAEVIARLAILRVHRIPHPTSVTIASRPSCGVRDARTIHLIWISEKQKYFFRRGWTGNCEDRLSGKSPQKNLSAATLCGFTLPLAAHATDDLRGARTTFH
jgi:hypothetical protein